MEDTVGVIYVLTNPSFPDYVKIGYASDIEERLKKLNRSECVPFAFRIYATYGVLRPLQDRELHAIIDRLNPELRAVETFNGKSRVKEFYAMSAEEAYALLEGIARLSGTEARLRRFEPTDGAARESALAEQVQAAAGERREPFRFHAQGIPDGAEIVLMDKPDVRATVLDDGRILCEDEEGELQTGTLAAFTKMHLGLRHVSYAYRYWSYRGVPLDKA